MARRRVSLRFSLGDIGQLGMNMLAGGGTLAHGNSNGRGTCKLVYSSTVTNPVLPNRLNPNPKTVVPAVRVNTRRDCRHY